MTRIHPLGAVALAFALGACSQVSNVLNRDGGGASTATPPTSDAPPAAAPESAEQVAAVVTAPRPSAAARTAAELDTTTDAQRAAARAEPQSEGQRLGSVTASLGDPTEPGLWIRTDLVSSVQPGRVVVDSTGEGGLVELRPLEGESGAALSLAAMQLLGVPLTDIPTVTVFSQ